MHKTRPRLEKDRDCAGEDRKQQQQHQQTRNGEGLHNERESAKQSLT